MHIYGFFSSLITLYILIIHNACSASVPSYTKSSCHHVTFMCRLDVRIRSKLFVFCRMLLFIVSSDYNDFD